MKWDKNLHLDLVYLNTFKFKLKHISLAITRDCYELLTFVIKHNGCSIVHLFEEIQVVELIYNVFEINSMMKVIYQLL